MSMEAFNNHGLIGKIVDKIPPKQMFIRYGTTDVQPGMTLTPTLTSSQPTIRYEAEPGSFYTVIMNDPDSPSRSDPKYSEFHHWLVVNIPGNDINKGETMSEYIGPIPNKGSGHHRYVFMMYKQSRGRMEFQALRRLSRHCADGRLNHRLRDFARRYNLGDPVSGNFFQAEWDESVPKLQEHFRM